MENLWFLDQNKQVVIKKGLQRAIGCCILEAKAGCA